MKHGINSGKHGFYIWFDDKRVLPTVYKTQEEAQAALKEILADDARKIEEANKRLGGISGESIKIEANKTSNKYGQ